MNRPSAFHRLAAWCAYLAPPLLMLSDGALVMFISTPGLNLQRIALSLFVPALIGVALLGRSRGRWVVTAGAILAAIGAGAIVLFPWTLIIALRFPAALFPLGLLIAAAGMIGFFPPRIAPLLAIGALMFPIGHISGFAAALIVSDITLLVAFWMLAELLNPRTQIPKSASRPGTFKPQVGS